ncbi:helix-turn-helix domain-containing protein [Pinisolibacter aquiterrae]|uniref:helix-turn-helix domain-containing protein n=1 Tax=Pinisolibacter aquiterrae TaxID=2815579 RepID=UPI001C3CFDD3|nr:helix-turn-helix domain-containing protein [Pinisolibacter aquiterrae]MBV5266624.1 helix-turn-helix domain-containing protein [Pinisolibacter aquiterrae]MCC8235834.1 helix-turn-helix domain-containing protein [Pinisolibacter aquiterrae]
MPDTPHRITDADRAVAARLRHHRQARGLTQRGLAALTSDTERAISFYERATTRVSARKLVDLARALEIPIAWFCADVDEEAFVIFDPATNDEATTLRRFLETPEGWELNRAFNRIASSTKRALILQLVEGLASEQAE